MAKCCGQERTTRYCPECGKPIALSPLGALLVQCRKTEIKYRNSAEKFLTLKDDEPPNDYYKNRATKNAALADKWKGWADALEEAIATQQQEPRP